MTNTNERTRESIIESIIGYLKENEEVFNDCIEELDGWDGYLGDDRYYPMSELNEFYSNVDVLEVLDRAYFGYDEESWYLDGSGAKVYGAFNPNREYFRYNGYGNLVSADYKDYSNLLNECAVDDMAEYTDEIYTINENDKLKALFEELKNISE